MHSEVKLRNKSQFQNVSSHGTNDTDVMNNLENGSVSAPHSNNGHDNFSNNDTDKNKKAVRNLIIITGLVMTWYFSAVFAITSSKMIMNVKQLPFFLCMIQFLCASIVTKFARQYLVALNLAPPSSSSLSSSKSNQSSNIGNKFNKTDKFTAHNGKKPTYPESLSTSQHHNKLPSYIGISQYDMYVYQIAISYTLGFIFTNIAFSVAPPSFAETIKAGEPISSVGLAYYFYNEGTTATTYATLIPICLGVGISCIDGSGVGKAFNFFGFINAAISNICFSGRAVISKQLFAYCAGSSQVDEIELFSSISRIGLVILVPTALLIEGSDIWSLLTGSWWTLFGVFRLLLLNGVSYSTYNLVSFLVLSRTDLITHAVLNVFRRVFIILFTSWFFKNHLSFLNSVGVCIAVSGVLLFAWSKHQTPVGGGRRRKLVGPAVTERIKL